ncbi:MAG: RNA polymerase sigma factor [Gammaproteobacteria bacterium]|nr:RNA polymerase sigma factor [Gammaproteobacteria bacterium]MBT8111812.1 RNA polymerase sigma factor [Gammaproteobacteria bacterium]NND47210.1 RNA polymerase sigma factor [Woeseiaceae bacterium]NNL46511.1 RNA polymerase sigma factor [Woeseiaceae bacterium]
MRESDALDKNPHVSRSALEAIHGQVYGWALSRSHYDRAVAEDLMQQAYVELLTGKARFDNKSSLKTFVFSIVQNLARSRYRRIASRLRLVRAAGISTVDDIVQPVEPNENAAVWQAVQELPERQRDIVELVFCRDMTIEAAAGVMGVTVGTGRAHYDRAKKTLKIKLKNIGAGFDD